MAAIVAQITKANWERKKKRKGYFPPEKSVYELPPFDERFDPDEHNVFHRRKIAYIKRHKEERQVAEVQAILEQLAKETERHLEQAAPLRTKLAKALLGAAVLSLPIAVFVFLLMTFWLLDFKKSS